MKDKNLAGILALFFGWLGIHRFYLGQIGWGIFYLFFFWFSWIISFVDAIVFFSMDKEEFDRKYNREALERQYRSFGNTDRRSSNRNYERPRQRATRRNRDRSATTTTYQQSRERATRPNAHNPFRESGIRNFKEFDYEEAIEDFRKSLEIDARDVATHFNLACCYSVTEKKDKAFYHLDRAVALGFDDWRRIKSHDALAYIRIQSEFDQFEANGFRLAAQLESPAAETETTNDLLDSIQQATQPKTAGTEDLLEQLRRLGELRDKGLLTDAEFATQKKKLLG